MKSETKYFGVNMSKKEIFKKYEEEMTLISSILDEIHENEEIKAILTDLSDRSILFNVETEEDGIFSLVLVIKDKEIIFEYNEISEKPDAVIEASLNVLIEILIGKLDPIRAYSLGKINASGSFTIAQELLEILQMSYEKIQRP